MNCASCHTPLPENSNYCNLCANKVQNGRITLKGTWSEFISPVFSWDNHFLKTFKHLITQPEKVLLAYINGDRKSYFKPFTFMIVYGVLYSLYFKFFQSDYKDILKKNIKAGYNNSNDNTTVSNKSIEFSNKLAENISFLGEWYALNMNFAMLLSVPIYAIISYIVYKKHKHNLAEHWVFNAYIFTIGSYFVLFYYISLNCLGISLYENSWISTISLISFLYFYNYTFYRLYKLKTKEIIITNLKFFGLLIPAFLFFMTLIVGIAIAMTLYQM